MCVLRRWPWMLLLLVHASQGADIHLVKLDVSPAGRPQPAMRYRLTPATRELVSGNAAALYYRAVIALHWTDRNIDNSDGNGDARAARDGEWLELDTSQLSLSSAKRGLASWSSALAEAKLGAQRSEAVWDLPLREEGIATLLLEIQEIRSLARLLALEAKVALAERRYNDAASSLSAMISMGRHVSQSGTVISALVGIACDGIALDEVEQWIGAADSPNLYWALTALPDPPIDTSIGLESEHLWLEAELPYLDSITNAVLSEGQSRELADSLGSFAEMALDQPTLEIGGLKLPISSETALILPAMAAYPTAKRELIAGGRDAAEVEQMSVAQVVALRWVEVYREYLDEMIAWSGRPYPEAQPALDEIDKRVADSGGGPSGHVARLLLPAMGSARRAEVRLQQRVDMLRIVEALRLYAASHGGGLPSTLEELTAVPIPLDPACGEPFLYELDGTTATLRSSCGQIPGWDLRYEISVRK